jgi:D-amino-acid dehydrogenase
VAERTCEVVVVGGGLVGTALAYELGTRGVDVLLVDANHRGRATDAGAGILSPETTWIPDEGWFSFGLGAAAHYRILVERMREEEVGDTGYSPCGLLLVAMEPGEDDWFATRAELALRRAPEDVHEVTAEDAAVLFPPLGEVRRAVYNRSAARVDGRSMLAALTRAAEKGGLRRLDATVTSLRTAHGRVVAVESDAGVVSCGTVALAGGAWSEAFQQELGVSIPVVPVKGQIAHMQLSPQMVEALAGRTGDSSAERDSARWPIVSPVLNHYLVAWPGGRVACGGTYEPDALYDSEPTVAGLEELLRAALAIAPGLAEAKLVDVRVGLRPVSSDLFPVLGPVPGWDNVHLVTGHGTEGLLLGPYSGALVAQSIVEEKAAVELAAFGLGRFTKS